VKAEKLPPHHACDHHIKLEGSLPPVGVIYSLSNRESDTLRAYISQNLEKGSIQPNSSPTGAPVLFVKNKDGGLCLCVDCHRLNAVTRKNKYSVPPMNQLLNVFNGSSIFSKIYMHGAYNLLRIKEGDEHLTAFRTKYGSLEYLVMPFGLTNAPVLDDIYPERGEDFISKNQMNLQQLIKQDEVQPSRYFAVKVESFSNLIYSIQKALWQDSQYRIILEELGKDVKRELEAAINRINRYADKGRASPPVFNPGDMYSRLPPQASIHPVFHISLLEPVKKSTIQNWHQESSPPIIIEEVEWEVSQILDLKFKIGKLWYLVEWKGFSQEPERSNWEPAKNRNNFPELVKNFHSLYPYKPGPNYSRA
ncbi:hypothetical protein O181_065607, partial [Austropuccinia psidii MF-1]|nr:hypothetical protein [Austropuccinia psidii MF-1]